MKKLTIVTLVVLFLVTCKKDINGDEYSFTGYLYKNCEKEPHANMELNVYNNSNSLVCRIGVTGDRWLYEPNQTSELYSRTRLRHPIKNLTDKAYTVQDTLLVSVTGNLQPIFSMNGPFINNHIYMSDLFSYGNLTDLIAPFSNSSETRVDFYWGIGIKDMQRSIGLFRNNNPQAVPRVPQRVCDGDTVVIDLRRKQ
jgi:hypothetical protein